MSRYTGAVRFPDGELMFFAYDGTTDIARPRLYPTAQEADAAWDTPTDQETRQLRDSIPLSQSERVDVMPYFAHGAQNAVAFASAAHRALQIITGPLSLDEVAERMRREDDDAWLGATQKASHEP